MRTKENERRSPSPGREGERNEKNMERIVVRATTDKMQRFYAHILVERQFVANANTVYTAHVSGTLYLELSLDSQSEMVKKQRKISCSEN